MARHISAALRRRWRCIYKTIRGRRLRRCSRLFVNICRITDRSRGRRRRRNRSPARSRRRQLARRLSPACRARARGRGTIPKTMTVRHVSRFIYVPAFSATCWFSKIQRYSAIALYLPVHAHRLLPAGLLRSLSIPIELLLCHLPCRQCALAFHGLVVVFDFAERDRKKMPRDVISNSRGAYVLALKGGRRILDPFLDESR